ncbi:hypothetical protein ABPG75_010610 [Micractinium tetrahymenae]
MREARAKAALLTLIMAALLAYLASLKLRLLRHRRRAAAAAAAPAPVSSTPQDDAPLKRPSAAINITATAVAGVPPLQTYPALDAASVPDQEPSSPVPAPLAALAPGASSTHVAAAVVTILPSTGLSPALVQRLERQLASAQHNKFVCLLLASMAKEQLGAVAAAQAAGDPQRLAAAGRLCFATVEAAGEIVAGAVFYPRDSSAKPAAGEGRSAGQQPAGDELSAGDAACRDSEAGPAACSATAGPGCCCCGAAEADTASSSPPLNVLPHAGEGEATACPADGCDVGAGAAATAGSVCPSLDPHVYVELIVSRQPGRGWGSLLLAAIEAHAARQPGCRSVKLLSVSGAQEFYCKRGYSLPDGRREMHKRLPLSRSQ